MSRSTESPEEFLNEVEQILKESPRPENQQLKNVLSKLTELANNQDAGTAEKAIQLLGTAAGQQLWQTPFRESGLLEYVTQSLDPSGTPLALVKQCLRVTGNCVADNDVNRSIVMQSFAALVGCLDKRELATTALAVTLNLCNDFEPAQIKAAEIRLDKTIAMLLVTDRIPEEAIEYATDLLTWTTENLSATQIMDEASVETFESLLTATLRTEEEQNHEFVAILAHYLQDPGFQQKVTNPDTLARLVDLTLNYESRLTSEEVDGAFKTLGAQQNAETAPSEGITVILVSQLINSLSAMTASDAFVHNFSIESTVVRKLISNLSSSAASPLTVCTCVMLGNLATSDESSTNMVEKAGLHIPLGEILSSRKESALLYAAAAATRHLAFPERNRTVLGETGLIETCCSLLLNQDPSVRGEAAAIICKLVSGNISNITRVVQGEVPEDIALAQLPDVETPTKPTLLYHIVSQALVPSAPLPSTNMKNPMIELGRSIIAILRHLAQSDADQDSKFILQQLLQTPLVARPLARLVRQRFYAEARSEGLLGLGLLAQFGEGAVAVIDELKNDSGLLQAIKEFIGEQRNDEAGMRRDHQNAIVLLYGLANNGESAMEGPLKQDVDALRADLARLAI